MKLKTSEEWSKIVYPIYKFYVVDEDGWDRRNFEFSWFQEKIDLDEFKTRCQMSSTMGLQQLSKFLDEYKEVEDELPSN